MTTYSTACLFLPLMDPPLLVVFLHCTKMTTRGGTGLQYNNLIMNMEFNRWLNLVPQGLERYHIEKYGRPTCYDRHVASGELLDDAVMECIPKGETASRNYVRLRDPMGYHVCLLVREDVTDPTIKDAEGALDGYGGGVEQVVWW
jgi:hypothetical protein